MNDERGIPLFNRSNLFLTLFILLTVVLTGCSEGNAENEINEKTVIEDESEEVENNGLDEVEQESASDTSEKDNNVLDNTIPATVIRVVDGCQQQF